VGLRNESGNGLFVLERNWPELNEERLLGTRVVRASDEGDKCFDGQKASRGDRLRTSFVRAEIRFVCERLLLRIPFLAFLQVSRAIYV
jgi:hypothetical protein